MPLIGLVNPSHDERANDEPGRLPKWLAPDELLATAARAYPNWSPWPYELIEAAVGTQQQRDYISTTALVGGCSRSTVLERREEYIDSLDNLYAALRGTMIHRTLEFASRPNSISEWRFFTTIAVPGTNNKVEVSCSPDIITWGPDTLGDYKTSENPPDRYPWKNQTQQVNLNAYIVRHAERWLDPEGEPADIPFDPRSWDPESLYLSYLGPKGPKVLECMETREVPSPKTGKLVRRRVPVVWDDEQVLAVMLPKLKALVTALEVYPEWPFDAEMEAGDAKGDRATGFEGPAGWACPGKPWCGLPNCLAKRYPRGLKWRSPE